jgi:AcrR family transcriptional regulator
VAERDSGAESNGKDTKQRILDAAERLFADQGFAASSLRSVTAEAGVNLAAVNYHFGSKESLLEAVLARRIEPMNRERLELLERLERPTVEGILEAFVGPALRMRADPERGGAAFVRLFGQILGQPNETMRLDFAKRFEEVAFRFVDALAGVLPELPRAEVMWRFLFVVGAMAHTMAMTNEVRRISHGLCDPSNVEATVQRLVPFLAAGMRTPAAVTAEGRR